MVKLLWKNSMVFLKKIKNKITVLPINWGSMYVSKRFETRVSRRYLYTCVHLSTFQNSQAVEATQVSNNG